MPQPGLRWRFITINTHGSWLHGDPRGFRSKQHRINSNGDYRNPPPLGEHAGLHEHRKKSRIVPVKLPIEVRPIVGKALIASLTGDGWTALALSVSSDHAHVLVELPDDVPTIKAIIGDAKRIASRAIKAWIPGSVWSEGCDYEPIKDASHQRNAFNYVMEKQGADSWTWSNREPVPVLEKPLKWKPGRR
jgi:REP element-mobilizing transposase RayT